MDEFKSHNHSVAAINIYTDYTPGSNRSGARQSGNTSNTGGTETRPRNIAMMYCIKY